MASTALKNEEEKREYFDTKEEFEQKMDQLVKLVKESKHMVIFTGAGISTSAGIADFRSGMNTVLPTGPGAWEKEKEKFNKEVKIVNTQKAYPTKSHMAIVKLAEAGILKYLISQNTDGLHKRSGFPSSKLAELHGNSNLEKCWNPNCKREFFRDFRVRTATGAHNHETARKCESCGQPLYDSHISFGESLPQKELKEGFKQCIKADLVLCLGSSLRVTPAANMPLTTAERGGKMVIVNLQKTPLDDKSLKIHSMIDDVMVSLMQRLNLEIPKFILKKKFTITKHQNDILQIKGVDDQGLPFSLFEKIHIELKVSKEEHILCKEPFTFKCTSSFKDEYIFIELFFFGHYGEKSISVIFPLSKLDYGTENSFVASFDPFRGEWVGTENLTEKKIKAIGYEEKEPVKQSVWEKLTSKLLGGSNKNDQ